MLRRLAVFASDRALVRRLVMGVPGLRRIALRFVAGADLPAAIDTVRALNARGIAATLNALGEHVADEAGAIAAADEVIEALGRIREAAVDSHVSVKLTRIGLDIDEGLCRTQLMRVLDQAAALGAFIRIDMEEAPYFDRTIALVEEAVARYGEATVGVVLQSYRYHHAQELEQVIAAGARVRLVKGGYRESPVVAYQDRTAIDRAFHEDIEVLLRQGHRPAIATHDPDAIAWTRRVQAKLGLPNDALEFQMLYGVRRDLQQALVRDGYPVRCYVPYGRYFLGYVLGSLRRIPGGLRQHARRDPGASGSS